MITQITATAAKMELNTGIKISFSIGDEDYVQLESVEVDVAGVGDPIDILDQLTEAQIAWYVNKIYCELYDNDYSDVN